MMEGIKGEFRLILNFFFFFFLVIVLFGKKRKKWFMY